MDTAASWEDVVTAWGGARGVLGWCSDQTSVRHEKVAAAAPSGKHLFDSFPLDGEQVFVVVC